MKPAAVASHKLAELLLADRLSNNNVIATPMKSI